MASLNKKHPKTELDELMESLFAMPRSGFDLYRMYIETKRKFIKENFKDIDVICHVKLRKTVNPTTEIIVKLW